MMTENSCAMLETTGAGFEPCVNTRLVAAVQTRSGARCHESANLLSAYYTCADVYRRRLGRGFGSGTARVQR